MTNAENALAASLLVIATWINPEAGIGAAFGSMFFMMNSDAHALPKKLGYSAISLVVGYGAGVAASGSWAMIAAAGTAAVAVVSLTALSRSIEKEGLGALRSIFEIIRGKK